MNRIGDRRKLHGTTANFDDDIHQRIGTSIGIPPSLEEMRKISKELEILLKEERAKRIEVEENFRSYQERIMTREKEFYSILEENHKQVRAYNRVENEESSKEIKKAYEELFTNFESANEATTELIEKKYKENLHTMERRIENIMEVFSEEIGKNKKVSNSNLEQIKNEVERALTLVKSIESENVTLRMNLKEEKYKAKVMGEERKLLLDEMVHKKFLMTKILNENKKLKAENETLKSLQFAAQENSETRGSRVISKTSEDEKNVTKGKEKKRRFFSNTFTKEESKDIRDNVTSEKTKALPHEESTGPFLKPAKSRLSSSHSYEHSQIPFQEGKITMKSKTSSLHNVKNKIKFDNSSKKHNENFFNKSFSINGFHEKNCMLTNGAPFQEKYDDDKITHFNEKTIQHLKQCLEREKKKTFELGKIITEIQNSNQEVNRTIMEMLNESRNKNKNLGAKDLESIMRSEKILYLISDMKKRLQKCEKPTVQCGWEEADINILLESFENKSKGKSENEKPIFPSSKSDIFVKN